MSKEKAWVKRGLRVGDASVAFYSTQETLAQDMRKTRGNASSEDAELLKDDLNKLRVRADSYYRVSKQMGALEGPERAYRDLSLAYRAVSDLIGNQDKNAGKVLLQRAGHYEHIASQLHKKRSEGDGSRGLEGKTTATAAVIGLLGAIFFFSSNLTGNVIGNSTTSNTIGVVLFLVGIVGAFFYFRKRR